MASRCTLPWGRAGGLAALTLGLLGAASVAWIVAGSGSSEQEAGRREFVSFVADTVRADRGGQASSNATADGRDDSAGGRAARAFGGARVEELRAAHSATKAVRARLEVVEGELLNLTRAHAAVEGQLAHAGLREAKLRGALVAESPRLSLGWGGVLVMILGVMTTCCCICCWLGFEGLTTDGKCVSCEEFSGVTCCSHLWGYLPVASGEGGGERSGDGEDDMDAVRKMVCREARYVAALPLLPLLLVSQTTCKNGLPTIGYLLYLPFLLRVKWIEYHTISHMLKNGEWTVSAAVYFLLGCLNHFDAFTDALFPLQAYRCDAIATPAFAASFAESLASAAAGAITRVHFWGLMAIVLLVSTVAQQAVSIYYPHKFVTGSMCGPGSVMTTSATARNSYAACAAEVAGMKAVAHLLLKQTDSDARMFTKSLIGISKLFLGNSAQMWLQSTFFGITFEALSTVGKAKVLVSTGLSLASVAAASGSSLASLLWELCKNPPKRSDPSFSGVLFFFVFSFFMHSGALGVCVWTATKLHMAFQCPYHIWNITSGCVSLRAFFM